MKTEEFDDAVKRKLESINPAIDEMEIERVHAYTMSNRSPFSMLGTNRAFWALMATGMLATGLLTWKLTSMNNSIQKTASIIPAQTAPAQSEANKSPKIIIKTDTVYLTKYVNKSQGLYEKPKGFINKITRDKSSKFTQAKVSETKPAHKQASKSFISEITGNGSHKFAQANVSETSPTDKQLSNAEIFSKENSNSGKQDDAKVNSESPSPLINKEGDNDAVGKPQPASATKSAAVAKTNDGAAEKKEPAKNVSKKLPVHNYSDEHKNP